MPGDPVVKTRVFLVLEMVGLTPGRGTKIPEQCGQKL